MIWTSLFLSLLASVDFAQALSKSDFRYFNSSTTVPNRSSNVHGTDSSIFSSTESSPVYSPTASLSTLSSSRNPSTSSSLFRRPSIVGSRTSPSRSSSFILSTTSSQRSSSRLGTRPSLHSNPSSESTTTLNITRNSTSSSSSPTRSKLSKSTATKSSSSRPSSRSVPTRTSTDLVSQASSIISSHNYRSFCSAELGYSAYRSTKSITTTVRASTVVTRYPTGDTKTEYTEYTSSATSTVPGATEDITTTPYTTVNYTVTQTHTTTVPSPSGSHQEKRTPPSRTPLSTPVPLQTYPPNILSSACSENVAKPSSIADTTTTLFFTNTHTYYATNPYATTTSIIVHRTTQTRTHGTHTSTSTFHTIEIDSFTFTTATATVTNCLAPTDAACPIPLLGQVNNYSITYLAALDNTTSGTLLPNITSACACAQACRAQSDCAGSYYNNGTCGYVGVARCEPGRVAAVYRGDGEGRPCEGWTVADGGCGEWGEGGG